MTSRYKNLNFKMKEEHLSDKLNDFSFRLSIEMLLIQSRLPDLVARRLLQYSDSNRIWKLKRMIFSKMSNMDLNDINVWPSLKTSLENGNLDAIENCLEYLTSCCKWTIFKIDDFKRLHIEINPRETSLQDNHNRYIKPLFEYFETLAGIPSNEHTIDLIVREETDPAHLKSFLEMYRENLRKICFCFFDHFNKDLILEYLSKMSNLKELEVILGINNFEESLFHSIRKIPNLEKLTISCSFLDSIYLFDLPKVKGIKIYDGDRFNSISIENCPNLEKLFVLSTPELRKLRIAGCPKLQEIDLSNCYYLGNIEIEDLSKVPILRALKCPNLKDISLIPFVEHLFLPDCH